MAFFDKVSDFAKTAMDKTSDFAKVAVDKAGDAVDITKLSAKIKGIEGDIKDVKLEIAESVLARVAGGEDFGESIRDCVAKIDDYKAQIANLRLEIAAIKNGVEVDDTVVETPAVEVVVDENKE